MKKRLSPIVSLGLAALIALAACAPASTPAPDVTSAPETKVAPSGFVCPEPNPRLPVTSREVNLFVWTEYIPQDTLDCFELVYGITVNREEYSANEEMYAKLTAGGGNYDLAQPTDYWVPLMIRQGLLQKLDKSRLPVLNGFDPNYLNLSFDPGNEYSVPYQAGTYGIVVNTEKVQNVPQAWADLWKPEYAGRMVFLDDSRATIGMTLLTLGYDLNTTDAKQLEEAKVKLAALAKGIKLFDSDSPKSALIAGDADLGMTWTGEAELAKRELASIEYIYPTEGTIAWMDTYVLLATAPHPDAAYAWLNYSMQPELFWQMLQEFPYTMPSTAALEFAKTNHSDLYRQYIESPITNTPTAVLQKAHRLRDVGEATRLYDRIWTEIKGGS